MPTDPDLEPIGYAEAVAELDSILAELDDDRIDIDLLAVRVRRAAGLVRLCRARIIAARVEIDQIVADLADDAVSPSDEGDLLDDARETDGA